MRGLLRGTRGGAVAPAPHLGRAEARTQAGRGRPWTRGADTRDWGRSRKGGAMRRHRIPGAARAAAGALLLCVLAGCAGDGPLTRRRVLIEEHRFLADGESLMVPLESGRYRAEVRATGDRVTVEWRGAPCGLSPETSSYEAVCEFVGEAQLVMRNPRESGRGGAAELRVKVVKIGP